MFLKKELTEYNRYQAFAVHMVISLVIFFVLLLFITQYWYPGILFDTGNGWKAIAMIVGIDLVLGPLLTLIVFNHNKNSLKLDLWIIALVQTAALAYGTWTIHQTRPVALAFINTHFMTIYANSELGSGIINTTSKLNTLKLFYPFEESNSNNLSANTFKPYDDFKLDVKNMTSVYKENDLIQLDPLISGNIFIRISLESGDILDVVKK